MGAAADLDADGLVTAAGPWQEVLLVCGKCARKMKKGGFGETGRERLPDAIKQELRARKRRRDVRVLEVGCLGVCPKGAVTVVRGTRPGEMLVVPKGADLSVLSTRLGLAATPAAE